MKMLRFFLRSLWCALILGHGGVLASELSQSLKSPSFVLLMRHAYAPGVGDPAGYSLQRCESQRLLNDEGQQQAQRIGQWLRRQGIEQAWVLSSVWCRCQETAQRLGLGPVKIEPSLASFFDEPHRAQAQTVALQQFVAQARQTKKDQALILVTHHVNIREYMGQDIGSGDMVLARVDAQGRVMSYKIYPSP